MDLVTDPRGDNGVFSIQRRNIGCWQSYNNERRAGRLATLLITSSRNNNTTTNTTNTNSTTNNRIDIIGT